MPNLQEIDGIAQALNRYEWVPSDIELRLGQAFHALQREMAQPSQPPMPPQPFPGPGQGKRGYWPAQLVVLHANLEPRIRKLIDQHAPELSSDSSMLALVLAYAEIAGSHRDLADRLLHAWDSSPPRPPTWEEVQSTAHRVGCSHPESWQIAAESVLASWHETHLTGDDRHRYERATHQLIVIGSTLNAAITGDVEW